MRVADSMLRTFVVSSNQNAKEALLAASEQVASGDAITKPSDDPAGAQRLVDLARAIDRLAAMSEARDGIQRNMEIADARMSQAEDLVSDVKALVIQMVSDGKNPADRQAGAEVARSTLDALLGLANQPLADGTYLFGGLADGSAPYTQAGVYQGDTGARLVEIAPGQKIEATLVGTEAFGETAAYGDAFDIVRQVIEALDTDDVPALQESLTALDATFDAMRAAHASVGSKINVIEDAESLVTDLAITYDLERDAVGGADPYVAASNVTAAQQTLTLVSQLGAQLLQKSILSFLG